MINLKKVRSSRGTKKELIEGMVKILLEHGYSVNEIQELVAVPYLLEVKGSCMDIFDVKGDIVF